jgi:hypothetical protein
MDILLTLLGFLLTVLGWILSFILWFLSFLLMPLLIVGIIAAIALRFAWRAPLTRPYIERLLARLGERGHRGAKRLVYLITVEPFRVIFRFIGLSILYSWVNLWWKPSWSPWERARERPPENGGSGRKRK